MKSELALDIFQSPFWCTNEQILSHIVWLRTVKAVKTKCHLEHFKLKAFTECLALSSVTFCYTLQIKLFVKMCTQELKEATYN